MSNGSAVRGETGRGTDATKCIISLFREATRSMARRRRDTRTFILSPMVHVRFCIYVGRYMYKTCQGRQCYLMFIFLIITNEQYQAKTDTILRDEIEFR